MKIFFYIERILLKIMKFIGYSILGVYFLGLAIGLKNTLSYKLTILELLGIIFIIYMIPKKRDRFGYRPDDPAFEKYKDLTDAILYRTYSPARSIPRIILLLINFGVLIYVFRILYPLFANLKI